jgi:hypothetical protein
VTISQTSNALENFQWTPQPSAESLIAELVEDFLACSGFSRLLVRHFKQEAGVRFADLIDSIHLPSSDALKSRLAASGFVSRPIDGAEQCFFQQNGIFPSVVLSDRKGAGVFLKVESVVDFLVRWRIIPQSDIDGQPLAPMRKKRVYTDTNADLWVIERHGYQGFAVQEIAPDEVVHVLKHQEAFRRRWRYGLNSESKGLDWARALIEAAIADLGVHRTCDLFFAAEREFWQSRNRAAQSQKARQDKLGIGWANHDHHTYRSSREHFATMIGIFELLGFHCRERFYAGAQAGWGAQVLEQPNAGIVIFADVDLSPDELFQDFAHEGLAPREEFGTVGLWCALHGEAFLEAGMHHLECQFDFDALKQQLEGSEGVKVMKPFTDFPYLRQAFTEGEIWPVRPERIDRLLKDGRITVEQAARFREHGAIGSHLENLERNQGFKGFNQTGVSEIIARTDPRTQGG